MKMYLKVTCITVGFLLVSCKDEAKNPEVLVTVTNHLEFSRNEVVGIEQEALSKLLKETPAKHIRIKKEGTEDYLRTQWIDNDMDGVNDELLFQAEVAGNASTTYTLVVDSLNKPKESEVVAYSRFVPERTDDYTWENDKVAFRTYGPVGQKEFLEGVPGSTMSSGIDLWLKKTDKSIINKWYAAHVKKPGYYHIDHGEGYDPYHVGGSRGTGGIGVWAKDSLYVSQNYIDYKTISDGPLRTVFDLTYAPWSPYNVLETKRITLDLGSNFSKFEISLSADDSIPNYTVGISLHKNEGNSKINTKNGWVRHWETIDDAKVGEGIVLNPSVIDSAFARVSKVADQSNILIVTKPEDTLTYYAGFVWEKSGQVKDVNDWDSMLERQAQRIKNPLTIRLK